MLNVLNRQKIELAGLDIGSSAVKLVRLSKSDDGYALIAAASESIASCPDNEKQQRQNCVDAIKTCLQKAALKKQSQDRLSYLLNAMKLAGDHRNSVIVPLITGTGTRQLSIRKKNRRHINTAAGRVLAQELELSYGIESPNRSLWLSLDQGCLPVLLEPAVANEPLEQTTVIPVETTDHGSPRPR